MKFLHNDKVSLGWAILVEIAVHALFAFQAFLLGGFLGEIALAVIFGANGAKIGAWALAIFVFGAAFQAFVLGEYMREHVNSFEATSKGDGSYKRSWEQVRWLVAGIEISSLLFRCVIVLQQTSWLQSLIVALIGGISLWYAFAQAKVIHASVNRPVEYDIAQAQDDAGRSLAKDAVHYIKKMTPEQKANFLDGDISALEEVAENDFFSQEQRRQAKEQREQAKAQKQAAKATKVLDRQQREEQEQERTEQTRDTTSKILSPKVWRHKRDTQPKDDAAFPQAQ